MNSYGITASLRIPTRPEDCVPLRESWNQIVGAQSEQILQLDVTSTYEWAMTLWHSHLDNQEQQVFALEDNGEVTGILPVYHFKKRVHGVPCRAFALLTELYSGRCGFLLREPRADQFGALLEILLDTERDWDVFQFSLVDSSLQQKEFFAWQRRTDLFCEEMNKQTSPYIPLQENWEQHFASLPKKFRSTIRNGEKRMREHGQLEYREFREVSDIDFFVASMLEIERDSWKEVAGTSLTTNREQEKFHTEFLKNALCNGWLCGHLLLLNNEPVAYINGLLYNGIFLDLKESYKAKYREMSPGHVLKSFAFQSLYSRKARIYDFMGVCEEYKMKWTDQTYTRSTYLLYNRTARAWAARSVGRFKNNSHHNHSAGGSRSGGDH